MILESRLEHRKSVAKFSVPTTYRGILAVLLKSTKQAVETLAASHGWVGSAVLASFHNELLQPAQEM